MSAGRIERPKTKLVMLNPLTICRKEQCPCGSAYTNCLYGKNMVIDMKYYILDAEGRTKDEKSFNRWVL